MSKSTFYQFNADFIVDEDIEKMKQEIIDNKKVVINDEKRLTTLNIIKFLEPSLVYDSIEILS